MLLTATLDAKAHPSVESQEVTVQSPNTEPNGSHNNTSRRFKFKNPLNHFSNILGFNSSSTAPKAQEKPIEKLQDLYNNDPEEQADNNFNNVNTSFNFGVDGSDTLSRDSIYFTPQDNLVTKDWVEETVYSKPRDDTLIQDLHSSIYDHGLSQTDLSLSVPLAEELPSAPLLEYLASAPSYDDSSQSFNFTNEEKKAIEVLDRVQDGDSAYNTLSDDTISDTSLEHSLESGCSIPTTPSIANDASSQNQVKIEIGGASVTIPYHFLARNEEDTSSLSNFSENDAEWEDDAIEDVTTRVTPELSNGTTNTEPVNTFNGSDTTKSSTPGPTQDLPKIVGYQYKEPLMPNNHYKAKSSSAEILAKLTAQDKLKDKLYKTLSSKKAAMEIEEEIDDELEAGTINSKEKEVDAVYLIKLSASEEARQTIASNKSAIAKNKALLEEQYATIAKSRLGLAYQDPDTEIGNTFTSECESKNNELVIDNDDAALTLPPPTEAELALMGESMIPNANGINTTQTIGYDVLEQEQERLPLPPYPVIEVNREENISEKDDEDLPFPPPPTAEELKKMGIASDIIEDDDLPFPPPPIEEELAELDKLATVSEDGIQNSITEADAAPSNEHYVQDTSMDKEELLKKASTIASSSTQARQASKIASHHIKHHIFARDIVTAAVAAGDDEADDAAEKPHGYSIWSSGTLASSKQKGEAAGAGGYSTKIAGGTIGADINLENDQLVGASFSKFSSRVKYQDQGESNDLSSSGKSVSRATRYDTQILSLYGLSPVSRNISLSAIGSAGYSKGDKAHSKLLSLESHLHYKIALPQNITLIPHIGFKYEYEKAKCYQEQIGSNLSIERGKKSYQAMSGEIGSRVIFAPIKLNASGTSNIILSNTILTPTAHFSVERRIGSRGGHSPYHLTYQGNGGVAQEIGASTTYINPQHQKTSFNAGIGLIASHQNIKLGLLYDHTRQKRFKSHQGVLKLKVSL
ncbi:autotransporter outer membrane beta-barrel domain-containing protein [Rickettsia endosymbiont of Gonocerus acuteangulatus]|uniref:autotransporter outer membrane beta-barrel domain-containing protein n=1 Tax=Rickettsia endosymbiont of Gonocerus acuteangulatus TaxID=3066266 RepID=UPI0031334CBA